MSAGTDQVHIVPEPSNEDELEKGDFAIRSFAEMRRRTFPYFVLARSGSATNLAMSPSTFST